jgi:starch synthase
LERARFRRTLLTNLIGGIEVSFLDEESKRRVSDILNHYSVVYNRVFSDDGPLVFSIGRLSRQKGFDYILRALDKLTLINPRIKLILSIIPLGYQDDSLKEWVEAVLSFPENLRVLPGVLSRENTVILYYASNTVLIPSRSEPFGLVALESMASGTPVVAARTGGLIDIVVDIERDPLNGVGLLFDVGDVYGLAEATGRLIEFVEPKGENVERARRLRMNCIKRAGEFNWRASAEKTKSIYREFIYLT